MVSLSLVAPDFGRRCRPAPSRRTRRLARCELTASVLCSNVPGLARRAIRMCGVTPLAEPVAWQNHAEFIGRHAFAAPWPTASDGDAFVWNDNHTSINSRRDAFAFFAELKRELVCFFPVAMALRSPAPQFGLGVEAKKREKQMKQLLKLTAAPAAALFALALGASAASAGEYCRTDVTSHMQSCSFDSMEQCQAMSSGRGGSCDRDPFLATARGAFAYQPKHRNLNGSVRRPRTLLQNR